MKYVLFVSMFFLFVGLSLQIPKFVNCPPDYGTSGNRADGCGVVTCHGPGSISGVGCGTWDCAPELYLGYREADNSKPYPDCCGGPICK